MSENKFENHKSYIINLINNMYIIIYAEAFSSEY